MQNDILFSEEKYDKRKEISKLRDINEEIYNDTNLLENELDTLVDKIRNLNKNDTKTAGERRVAIINDFIFIVGNIISIIFLLIISNILHHFEIALLVGPILSVLFASSYTLGGSFIFPKIISYIKIKLIKMKMKPLKKKIKEKNNIMNNNAHLICQLEEEIINIDKQIIENKEENDSILSINPINTMQFYSDEKSNVKTRVRTKY